MSELRKSVAQGTVWNGIASILELFLGLGTTILLMKLLLPGDFGLVAAAGVFINLAARIGEGGIKTALIQNKDEEGLYSSALVSNLLLTLAVSGVVCLLSRPIAFIYQDDRLVSVVFWLALGMAISGVGLVPSAWLTRQMLFGRLVIVSVVASFCSACVALYLAYIGKGVWALISQVLVKNLLKTVLHWVLVNWRGLGRVSMSKSLQLLNFGYKVVVSDFMNLLGPSGMRFILARVLGTPALGVFAAGWRLVSMPVQVLSNPLVAAVFPALCRRQDNKESVRNGYYGITSFLLTLVGPLVMVVAVSAGEFLPLVTDKEWEGIIPVVRVLAGLSMVSLMFGMSYLVFLSMGKPEYRLVFLLVQSLAMIVGVAVGTRWGLVGASAGAVIGSAAPIPLQFYLLKKVIPFSVGGYFRNLGYPLLVTLIVLIACGAALATARFLALERWSSLAVIGAFGLMSYYAAIRILMQPMIEQLKLVAGKRLGAILEKLFPQAEQIV